MTFRLKSPAVKLSENDVERASLDLLRLKGWWPIRQHVAKLRMPDGRWISIGQAGDPDYVVVRPPSFFLEVKRPGAKPSAAQLDRIAQLRLLYRLETVVIDDVRELKNWLDRHE